MKNSDRPQIKPADINRATRRAARIVLEQVGRAFNKKTATYKQMELAEPPTSNLDKVCDAHFGKDNYERVEFNPFLTEADAHIYLFAHAKIHTRGYWKIVHSANDSDHDPFKRARSVNTTSKKITYKEYDVDRVVDAHPIYIWRDCLVMVHAPTSYNDRTSVLVTPKGMLQQRLREFNEHYLANCFIKNKYVEVWVIQGHMQFHVLDVEVKDAIHEDADEFKFGRITRIIDNWDKLSKGDRRMGFLLYGPPGTGKTATISQLVTQLKGKATILNLKGGSQAALINLYEWLDRIGPNLVIAEDFDTIAADRSYHHGGEEKFISLLLNVLDGARNHDVITLATTNYPEKLDQALTRPGRLGVSVKLGEPSSALRKKIIAHYLVRFGLDEGEGVYYEALDQRGVLGCHVFSILKEVSVEVKLGGNAVTALKHSCEAYFGSSYSWENKKPMGFGKDR